MQRVLLLYPGTLLLFRKYSVPRIGHPARTMIAVPGNVFVVYSVPRMVKVLGSVRVFFVGCFVFL